MPIELMRPLDTKCCEIIATLYAAWNDLLLLGKSPSDEEIVIEATEKWHQKSSPFHHTDGLTE